MPAPPNAVPPSRRARLLVALAIGLAAGAFLWWRSRGPFFGLTDIDLAWHGARALFGGRDPYVAVGPTGTEFRWGWPLYYPATALVAFGPFALLPLAAARLAFVGVSAALLAYGVTRDGWRRLLIFGSGAYLASAARAQWAPLLTAGLVLPAVALFVSAKPNLGAAVFLGDGWRDRRGLIASVGGSVALIAVSLALLPRWPLEWLAALHDTGHVAPAIARPWGWLLALALLRGRRRDAQLLLAMAVLPLNPSAPDLLPLLLIPTTIIEGVVLALGTLVVFAYVELRCIPLAIPFAPCMAYDGALGVWLVYLPCLAMVLRRPNIGGEDAVVSVAAPRRLWARAARWRGV